MSKDPSTPRGWLYGGEIRKPPYSLVGGTGGARVGATKLEVDGAKAGTNDVSQGPIVRAQTTVRPTPALLWGHTRTRPLHPIQIHGRRTLGGDVGGGTRRQLGFGRWLGVGVAEVNGWRLVQLHRHESVDILLEDKWHPPLSHQLKTNHLLHLLGEDVDERMVVRRRVERVGDEMEGNVELIHCGCQSQSHKVAILRGSRHPGHKELRRFLKEEG